MQFACFECGELINVLPGQRILHKDVCPSCSTDLRVCLNCRHYDPVAHNQCREPQAEWQRYKEKANYCDYFDPRPGDASADRPADESAEARKKWDELFKK